MTPIRIAGVPEPYNLPWHLAMEKGAFAAAGFDVQWHTVPEGSGRMCQMLRDGELDMAVLVTEAAVRDRMNGGPHRIVSTFVDSPLPWGVHVPERSNLHVPEDLIHVPFAISRLGSGSHLMAMLHASKLGWRPSDSDFIIVHNMEGAAERMRSGEPMVFLWEKFVTSRYVDSGVMRKVDEIQGDWPGFVIVGREGFVQRSVSTLDLVLHVLRAEVRSLVIDDRTSAQVMAHAGFGAGLATAWLRTVRWNVGPVHDEDLIGLRRKLARLERV